MARIGLGICAKNFKDRDAKNIVDLRDATHENLQNYFLITDYGQRKKIMKEIQRYIAETEQKSVGLSEAKCGMCVCIQKIETQKRMFCF